MPVDAAGLNSGLPVSPITAGDISSPDGSTEGMFNAVGAAKNDAASKGQQLGNGLGNFDLVGYIGRESTMALDSIYNQLRNSNLQRTQGG